MFFIGCVHLWVALNETAIMDALAAAVYNLPVLEAERMNSGGWWGDSSCSCETHGLSPLPAALAARVPQFVDILLCLSVSFLCVHLSLGPHVTALYKER